MSRKSITTREYKAFLELGSSLKFIFRGLIIKIIPPIKMSDGSNDFSRSVFINGKLSSEYDDNDEVYKLWTDWDSMTEEETKFKTDYLFLVELFRGKNLLNWRAENVLNNFIISKKAEFNKLSFYKILFTKGEGKKLLVLKEFNEERARISSTYRERIFETDIISIEKYKDHDRAV